MSNFINSILTLFVLESSIYTFLLTLSLNFPEHLKVTTFLASNIISSPVAGFRPLRSDFSFIQNFPKPLIRTSSPDIRVSFIIFRRVSTVSEDCFLVKLALVLISSTIWNLVRVIVGSSC